jgi:LPXTG-motif cell wall-anchored protein
MRLPRSSLRLLAAAGLCLATTLTTAPAAHADDGTGADLSFWMRGYAVSQALGEQSAGKNIYPTIYNGGTGTAHHVTLTIDTSQASKVLLVRVPGCDTSGTVITCSLADLGAGASDENVQLNVRVAAGARVGQVGTLDVTVRADNAQPAEYPTDLMVAAPGEDGIVRNLTMPDVKPGSTVTVKPVFGNQGDQPMNGFVLAIAMYDKRYFSFPQWYDGCAPDPTEGYAEVCPFPNVTLPSGTGLYSVDPGFPMVVSGHVPGPRGNAGLIAIFGMDTAKTLLAHAQKSAHTGRALPAPKLVSQVSAHNSESDDSDNTGDLIVDTTTNPADLAAIGGHVTGPVGATVPVTVGATNNGPGDTVSRADAHPGFVTITAPTGTVFGKVPPSSEADCAQLVNGQPVWDQSLKTGYRQYECGLGYATGSLAAGASDKLHFGVTIRSADVGSDGSVYVWGGATPDGNAADDRAALTVTVGSASPSSHPSSRPSASPSAPAAGGNGGGSGSLPVTGTQVGLYAGVGAAVLLGGAVLVVLARRRRARG